MTPAEYEALQRRLANNEKVLAQAREVMAKYDNKKK